MSAVIIVAGVIYAMGLIGTAFVGWSNWSVARHVLRTNYGPDQPDYLGTDFVERQRARYERDALAGARLFTHSPLWPLLALGALARLISDSKKDPNA